MKVYHDIDNASRGLVKAWTEGLLFEDAALEQLRRTSRMPFVHKWVAAMPDVHVGKGCSVGSVVPTRGAIIPACVGVDLGCGMMAIRTSLLASQLPDNLGPIRSAIEEAVPCGETVSGQVGDRGAWNITNRPIPDQVARAWASMMLGHAKICEKYPAIRTEAAWKQLGTLGSGNHFIELCLDEEQRVWVMLHSGSRGVGGKIGTHFTSLAKREMERYFIHLPDADLSYLVEGSEHFNDYITALSWAQNYAKMNRDLMMTAVFEVLWRSGLPSFSCDEGAIDCHHNYVEMENHYGKNVWVTRKGAVRARLKDLGIIPGSMGAKSFIVRGKQNPESFHSCSHGAGRIMSRTVAKRTFTIEDHKMATAGVECRKDEEVIDETPMAYKNIDDVMAAQSDLVEVVHTLKQVLCVKG